MCTHAFCISIRTQKSHTMTQGQETRSLVTLPPLRSQPRHLQTPCDLQQAFHYRETQPNCLQLHCVWAHLAEVGKACQMGHGECGEDGLRGGTNGVSHQVAILGVRSHCKHIHLVSLQPLNCQLAVSASRDLWGHRRKTFIATVSFQWMCMCVAIHVCVCVCACARVCVHECSAQARPVQSGECR